MKKFASEEYYNLTLKLTEKLCKIPAPSGLEDKRAEYIKEYLHNIGYINAYIDSAKNVIWELKGNSEKYTLFMAHTDTVFPDLEPMTYVDDGEFIRCPGVCDDTVCVAMILAFCKYLKDIDFKVEKSILFSANACEEGLGDLKGCKQIFKDFANRIDVMFTLDGGYNHIVNRSVGSHRYKVVATTQGGHSYGAFGKTNAINVLSSIISKIYQIQVPQKVGAKTTYNVGTINGGTSVNTIAQSAEMLCEYRSDDNECLKIMQDNFNNIFDQVKNEYPDATITIELVGNRPGMGDVDKDALNRLSQIVIDIQEKHSNAPVKESSGSTDCNISHSLGIPAICVGVYKGAGVHTREEYLEKASITVGLNVLNDLFMMVCK